MGKKLVIKNLTTLLILLTFIAVSYGQTSAVFFNNADKFLRTHVHNGKVDYRKIKQRSDKLADLVEKIRSYNLEHADKPHKMAFWINAYNLLVIQAVVAHYPLQSPMDVKGFFDKTQHTVAGGKLTLNDIENVKLRQEYHDARIHFALVCAAQSCPPIIAEAYCPATIETQLEAQARHNLNDQTFVRVDAKEKKVLLSELFRWYESDFADGGKTILEYINQFRAEKIPEDYEVGYYTYDWRLNQIAR